MIHYVTLCHVYLLLKNIQINTQICKTQICQEQQPFERIMFYKQTDERIKRERLHIICRGRKNRQGSAKNDEVPDIQLPIIVIIAYTAEQHDYIFLSLLEVYLVGTSYALCAHSFPDGRYVLALPGRCIYYNSLYTRVLSRQCIRGVHTYECNIRIRVVLIKMWRGLATRFVSFCTCVLVTLLIKRSVFAERDKRIARLSTTEQNFYILILLYSRAYMEQCDIKLIEIFTTNEHGEFCVGNILS